MIFLRTIAKLANWLPALALGCLLAAAGVCALAAPSVKPDDPPKSGAVTADDVIGLVLKRSPDLHSYAAHAAVQIQQLDFPWLHAALEGHVYYKAPGYSVYDFPHTPSFLRGITRVEGAMGMATRWERCYNISVRDRPDAYLLHMVPKIRGEILALDVVVNKKNGDLQHFTWSYYEPSDATTLTQYYTNVSGYDVVTLQHFEITRHHIRAKATGTFDSFVYNVPVPTPTPTPSDPLHQCDN